MLILLTSPWYRILSTKVMVDCLEEPNLGSKRRAGPETIWSSEKVWSSSKLDSKDR